MVPLAMAFLERGDDVLWATGSDSAARLEAEGITTAPVGMGEREAMAEFYRRFPEVHELPPPARSDFMFPRLFGTIRAAALLTDLAPVCVGVDTRSRGQRCRRVRRTHFRCDSQYRFGKPRLRRIIARATSRSGRRSRCLSVD